MPRVTDAATLAALADTHLGLYLFAAFDFSDGTQRLWTGPVGTTILWSGQTWIGTGDLAALDRVAEDAALAEATTTASLRLDGPVGEDVVDPANADRAVTIYWVLADSFRGVLLDTPAMIQVYAMGGITVRASVDDETGGITRALVLELAPEPARLSQIVQRRLSDQDCLAIDPNDHFCEFAADPDLIRTGGTAIPTGGGGTPGEPGETQPSGPGGTDTRLIP